MHIDEDSPSEDPTITLTDLSAAEESDDEEAADNKEAPSDEEDNKTPSTRKGRKAGAQGNRKQTLEHLPVLLTPEFYAAAAQPEKICGFSLDYCESPCNSEESAGRGGKDHGFVGVNYHSSNKSYRVSMSYAKPGGRAFLPPH
jgi:hypothetical protein